MIRRRHLLAGAACLALAPAAGLAGERLTLLVGAKAGAPVDLLARAFLPFLARQLRSASITVSNIHGDAGLAAFQALAQAEPTGTHAGLGVHAPRCPPAW
ncbi:MAG: hypothetical protein WDN25_30850 [Acetobacteraceae bacterium]